MSIYNNKNIIFKKIKKIKKIYNLFLVFIINNFYGILFKKHEFNKNDFAFYKSFYVLWMLSFTIFVFNFYSILNQVLFNYNNLILKNNYETAILFFIFFLLTIILHLFIIKYNVYNKENIIKNKKKLVISNIVFLLIYSIGFPFIVYNLENTYCFSIESLFITITYAAPMEMFGLTDLEVSKSYCKYFNNNNHQASNSQLTIKPYTLPGSTTSLCHFTEKQVSDLHQINYEKSMVSLNLHLEDLKRGRVSPTLLSGNISDVETSRVMSKQMNNFIDRNSFLFDLASSFGNGFLSGYLALKCPVKIGLTRDFLLTEAFSFGGFVGHLGFEAYIFDNQSVFNSNAFTTESLDYYDTTILNPKRSILVPGVDDFTTLSSYSLNNNSYFNEF